MVQIIKADIPLADGITEFHVSPISFLKFINVIDSVVAVDQSESEVLINRARILAQTTAHKADGTAVSLDHAKLTSLPRKYASLLLRAIAVNDSERGEVISKGDGISTPVLYRLGSPLVSGDITISELEFQAKTFGDVEHVLAESMPIKQVLALLKHNAVPVLNNTRLQKLPDSAIEAVSLVDGAVILESVLPSFLD